MIQYVWKSEAVVMKKYISYESIIGNFLILEDKRFIRKRELEKFYDIVEQLLPNQYCTYPDITLEEFCDEYSFLIKSHGDIAIPIEDKEKLIEYFALGLPKSITKAFKDAFAILKVERISSKNDLIEYQQDYLTFLNYLKAEKPQQARQEAMDSLMRTGIIDENCNLKAPYNGENVNEDDFTRGPKLIKK